MPQREHVDLAMRRHAQERGVELRPKGLADGDVPVADEPHAVKIVLRREQFLDADDRVRVRVFQQTADRVLFVGEHPIE